MKCSNCGQDYPSHYYFKTENICNECYHKLSPEDQHKHAYAALMKHPLTSTTFNIEGYTVIKHLGVVRGVTVRSRSVFGTLGGELQTIIGGNITMFTDLCEKTREEAFEMMFSHAVQIGGNAVIGIRYDANDIMSGVTEVLCYGTAVIVEPKK